MTVVSNDRRRTYPGNGVANVFTGPKAVLASHIAVYLVDDATQVATLVSTGDYTLAGVGGRRQTTVTMTTPPPLGETLLILRTVPYEQDADISNQGAYLPEVVEQALDDIVRQTQQLADVAERALRIGDTVTGFSPELTSFTPLAPIVINAAGNGIEPGSTSLTGDMLLRGDLADQASGNGASLVLTQILDSGLNPVAGSVPRTVRSKLGENISILDFIPQNEYGNIKARTSTYDCLASINAAVGYLSSLGGGVLHFPAGLYPVSDTVVIEADGITLQGVGCHSVQSNRTVAITRESANSSIVWAGASVPPALTAVVRFQAHQGGRELNGCGMRDIGIDGNMQAPVGLQILGSIGHHCSNVTVYAVTNRGYDFAAPRYALAVGSVGTSIQSMFVKCGFINYNFNGGSGAYYDNTARGFYFRQDTTIQANNGTLELSTFIDCQCVTSRGESFWIESAGQNTFIGCHGGAAHPSGEVSGYSMVLGGWEQDSNPGIALWGSNPGAARYNTMILCEMKVVAKAAAGSGRRGSYGNYIMSKSMGNVSPLPVIEKGPAGAIPAHLMFQTLGSPATATPSRTQLGEEVILSSEMAGNPSGVMPRLILNKRFDVGSSGKDLGEMQWWFTDSGGIDGVFGAALKANIVNPAGATPGVQLIFSCADSTSGVVETPLKVFRGILLPNAGGGGATNFQGQGTVNVGTAYYVANTKVIGAQATGWTAGTGTALKTAWAAYAGQTHTGSYVQGTVQALDNAARDTSQRVKALEDALRTHGLIN